MSVICLKSLRTCAEAIRNVEPEIIFDEESEIRPFSSGFYPTKKMESEIFTLENFNRTIPMEIVRRIVQMSEKIG